MCPAPDDDFEERIVRKAKDWVAGAVGAVALLALVLTALKIL